MPTGSANTQENCSTPMPGCAAGRGAGHHSVHPTPKPPPRRVPFHQGQRRDRPETLSIAQCGLEAPDVGLRNFHKNPKPRTSPPTGAAAAPPICKLTHQHSQWENRGAWSRWDLPGHVRAAASGPDTCEPRRERSAAGTPGTPGGRGWPQGPHGVGRGLGMGDGAGRGLGPGAR